MNEFEVKEKLANQRKDIKSFDDLVLFLKNVKEHYNCGYGEAPRAIAPLPITYSCFISALLFSQFLSLSHSCLPLYHKSERKWHKKICKTIMDSADSLISFERDLNPRPLHYE